MDYFDQFTSEENINKLLATEALICKIGQGEEVIDENEDLVFGFEDANIQENDWIPEYKSRQSKVMNGNRSSSKDMTINNAFLSKYKTEAENGRLPIAKFLMNYLKYHMEELSTRGPSRAVKFMPSDRNNYFSSLNIDPDKIKDMIAKSVVIKKNWMIDNDTFNMTAALLSIYYWNNMTDAEKKNKNFKNTSVFMSTMILSIRFYSSLQIKYFKYGADEDEMNAVLDDMSGRHNATKFNSIYEYLEFVTFTMLNNAKALLENPTDFNISYFLENLNQRINSFIKGIANEFWDRRNSGKKTSKDTLEKTNQEGDRYLDVSDNISNDIAAVTRKIALKLSQDSSVNDSLLIIACKQTKISQAKMKMSLNSMIMNDRDLVISLISLIIAYYLGELKKPKSTIRSVTFITLMKKVYSISNTNSDIVLRLKDTLETLLKKHSKEYLKTNRVATLSNLRATCYFYWVLYINAKCE